MKLLPKCVVVTLCSNLILSCFGGINTSKSASTAVASQHMDNKKQDEKQVTVVLEGAISSAKNAINIRLTTKQLRALKEQFDHTLITPAEWGKQKSISFNYPEIFETKGGHVGHYDPNKELSKEQRKKSSFFPTDWQPNKVMSKIKEAYLHPTKTYFDKKAGHEPAWIAEGQTSEGKTIRIVFAVNGKGKPTGKVKTAYPIK